MMVSWRSSWAITKTKSVLSRVFSWRKFSPPSVSKMKIDSESDIYKDFKKSVPGFYERIDSLSIPDIHYCIPCGKSGWIECKFQKEWPKKKETACNFGLRPEQAIFLSNYCKYGKGFLLVWIEGEYLLFSGKDAFTIRIGGITQAQARLMALEVWDGNSSLKNLIRHF